MPCYPHLMVKYRIVNTKFQGLWVSKYPLHLTLSCIASVGCVPTSAHLGKSRWSAVAFLFENLKPSRLPGNCTKICNYCVNLGLRPAEKINPPPCWSSHRPSALRQNVTYSTALYLSRLEDQPISGAILADLFPRS